MMENLDNKIKAIYEDLHKIPEISWQERETTEYLFSTLEAAGLNPHKFPQMTGLYVDIGQGDTEVGFRVDIDALSQQIDGKPTANHSCGHDGHMAVGIGLALLLKEKEDQLARTVRIIFQPAEETGDGAKAILKTGIIKPLKFLFGMHVRPATELSAGMYSPAIAHGSAKLITGEILGLDAHGARPEQGINAIEVASALVEGLKRIWLKSSETASIKMTSLQAGGKSANIIPGQASFSIDLRAQKNATMDLLTDKFQQVITSVEDFYQAEINYSIDAHIVAAQVSPLAKKIMSKAIETIEGEDRISTILETPGGEDFHFYTYENKGLHATMLGLGCGLVPGLHHPDMTFNKDYLLIGTKIIFQAILLAIQELDRGETDRIS